MRVAAQGLSCQRCGGRLRGGDDPERLRCAYCDTHHLLVADEDVAAFAPSGRIGRRRARRVLASALAERGVKGFAIEDARLAWLPFWHVRGKLVGWQVYRQVVETRPSAPSSSPGEVPLGAIRHEERTEELVARDVDVTLPGCDARSFGLVGIADRLRSLKLRPFDHEREAKQGTVCAVVVPRAAAQQQAETLRATGVAPRNAVALKQRLSLARVRLRLVYYPVWKLHVTVDGVPAEVDVDAVRGRVVQGSIRRAVPSRALPWWGGAAAAGWFAGVHPLLGLLGLGGWMTDRLRRSDAGATPGLLGWLSEELAPVRIRRIRLDD